MSAGGARPGAGRKRKYGSPTMSIRVPVDRIELIRTFLIGNDAESLHDTQEQEELLTRVREVITLWQARMGEKATQPRWANVARVLEDLHRAIVYDTKSTGSLK